MNNKSIIILGVLGVIIAIAYFFLRKQSTDKLTTSTITTSNTSGLSALLDTKAGSGLLNMLFSPSSIAQGGGASSSVTSDASQINPLTGVPYSAGGY